MNKQNIYDVLLVMLVLTVFVVCGCSGSSSTSNVSSKSATVTGTVSGTTVVAYDMHDQEIARNTATGNPKTFSLSLTVGSRSYRFYLIENEGTAYQRIYPLYSGSTNVFELNSAGIIDLGYVDTSSGVAVPANSLTSESGVVAMGVNMTTPAALANTAFDATGFQGSWDYLGLVTGDGTSQKAGWYWGALSAAADGTTTFSTPLTDSLGNTSYPSTLTYSVSNSGILTVPSVPALKWFGVINNNKKTAVSVATMAPGSSSGVSGYNLQFALKSGATYSSSDLQGTWNVHGIAAGVSPQWLGWLYGVVAIDGNGSATWSSINRSDSNSTLPGSQTVSISSSGIITGSGSAVHGVMSQDKSMFVLTITDGSGGSDLLVYQKSGATFSSTDLQGTWNVLLLVSGNSPQWSGWAHGVVNIASTGAATWTSLLRSDGTSLTTTANGGSSIADRTLSLSSNGILTSAGTGIHGAMSQDKSLFVLTYIDGGGGYGMMLYQK